MTEYAARLDGTDVSLAVESDGLAFDGQLLPWHAVDTLGDEGPAIDLGVAEADGSLRRVRISHLGAARDTVASAMRDARGAARRRALAQSDLPVIEHVVAHRGDHVVDVSVLPQGLVVEPRGDTATYLPWGLVRDVQRTGHRLAFATRWGPGIEVSHLGAATDEFLLTVARARNALESAAHEAARALGGPDITWVDGWATSDARAVEAWAGLDAAGYAAHVVDVCDDVRAGIFTEGGTRPMPFLLGGAGSVVIVEGVGERDRATFAFDTADIERVNAALLTCSFRREVLFLPETELGPWAAALRTENEVAWLRSALRARWAHDDRWEERLREIAG